MIVVSNSSPLIALGRVGRLDLLPAVFDRIVIPEAVYHEVVVNAPSTAGANVLRNASWLTVRPIQDTIRRDYLLSSLDIGESEAIVLAQELRSDWLLLDEIKARSMARRLSIRIAGTGALLGMAKQRGTLPLVKPLLDELVAQDFRISADVYRTILMQNGE